MREICYGKIKNERNKKGGTKILVEIDETKLGKRKYNSGHRVEGVWVIVGVERTTETRRFAVKVESRDQATIERIIAEHVEQGS